MPKLYGQALDQLLADPEMATRMGRHGHLLASEKFRFDFQIDRTEAMLQSAADK